MVGAGPAGLAAAVAAVERGRKVVVVDAGEQPGGQFWRHPNEVARPGYDGRGQHAWPVYTRLRSRFDAAVAREAVTYRPGRQVWMVSRKGTGFEVRTTPTTAAHGRGTDVLECDRLVLCTGAYDRQLPVPGWDLPGVMSAGGVQAFVKANGVSPGRRVVVAGTGPFLLPVAASVARAGATVAAVCESASLTGWLPHLRSAVRSPAKLGEAAEYAATFARHRIRWRTRTVVTEVLGSERVTGVRLSRVDAAGRVLPGRDTVLTDVDVVGFGWGFTPQLELATALGARTRVDVDGSLVGVVDDRQATDVPGLFLAGELTGVGGALLAVAEGTVAGASAAGAPSPDAALVRDIRRHRDFAAAMHTAHPVPAGWESWLTPDTLVCRCEEVPYERVRQARTELGADDARGLKSFTRTGMGWCQGRICGFAAGCLSTSDTGQSAGHATSGAVKRPLAAPVRIGDLAELPTTDREGT
ncbi:thioredoxin reductase [Saccharomonospora cyanea NA-134]|uniref:Thioredoxin reductase n=1 Tax=Saccharomonospora cyanea NA-134 TaxID=882082 RepID=H5XE51_9PSEU|nr:thioredoxin reductase [Saccharomonospora cyanea NA-134]